MSKSVHTDPAKLAEIGKTLAEALPYMREFSGQTFVVKFGGHAMGDDELAISFAQDIVMLRQVGIHPVVVHGGGPQIGEMLARLNIESSFVDGLRVTDRKTVDVVEMVLSGSINKKIVDSIHRAGGTAIGLSGKDGRLIEAQKLRRTTRDPDSNIENVLDLGFVGEPVRINTKALDVLKGSDIIPIIAPIGVGPQGETYNINADTAAGAIAGALGASKLLMLTDVAGVLDQNNELIPTLAEGQARDLLDRGVITGGMIPKVETCLDAVRRGADAVHILDGRIKHVLLLEIFTAHGVGTMIRADG
ncbi:MAG: acetylglutamate kinase [Proteobacteria bacterium]|nr:acetylglutamate kinase [Pseudomonadota bacterium]